MDNLEKLRYVIAAKGGGYSSCFITENNGTRQLHLGMSGIGSDEPIPTDNARQIVIEPYREVLTSYNIPVPDTVSVSAIPHAKTQPTFIDDPKDSYKMVTPALDISRVEMEKVQQDYDSTKKETLRRTAQGRAREIVRTLKDEHTTPQETAQVLATVIHDVRNALHPSKPDKEALMSALQTRLTSRGEPQR